MFRMAGGESWQYVSEDDGTISLHDCLLDGAEIDDRRGWICRFSDGFDVCRGNRFNPTGRHRRSGTAAVVLHEGRYLDGTLFLPGEREGRVSEEQFAEGLANGAKATVLSFEWDRAEGRFSVELLWGGPPVERGEEFARFRWSCRGVDFCWNELPEDAWFEGWPPEETEGWARGRNVWKRIRLWFGR